MTKKLNTYDPIQFFDQGGSALGDMRETPEGDWVRLEDATKAIQEVGYDSLKRHFDHFSRIGRDACSGPEYRKAILEYTTACAKMLAFH